MSGQPGGGPAGRARGAGYRPLPWPWRLDREECHPTLEAAAVQARRWPAQARVGSARPSRAPCWPLAGGAMGHAPESAILRGQDAAASSAMDGSCPDGPGHGAASGPGYCRGPVAERHGMMGRYSRAMARACQPPGASRPGCGLLAAPRPCPDLEAAPVGRYSRATPRAIRPDTASKPGVRAIPRAPLACARPDAGTSNPPGGRSHQAGLLWPRTGRAVTGT